jgi:hypothetical protein
MHYCVYVFIPNEGDLEELVASALRPYDEDLQVPPYKSYLDAGEIKAMAKHYGMKATNLGALALRMDDWKRCPGGVEGNRLFAVKTWNPDGKWDWYEIGGRWRSRLRGNVAGTQSLLGKANLQELLPFGLVTPDGRWHERETFITKGWMKYHVERKTDSAWLKEVRRSLRRYPTHRVVCVDAHS